MKTNEVTGMVGAEFRYAMGSLAYCDIANDEAGRVCVEFATDSIASDKLYEKFCGAAAEGVEWPEDATEEQIRAASREDCVRKLEAAGYRQAD